MNYFLNSFEQKGNHIAGNIDEVLHAIMTMVKAEVVQLLFEPSGKCSFNNSHYVYRNDMPEQSFLQSVTEFTQRNSHISQGEIIELPQSVQSHRATSQLSWWSVPMYTQQKRQAVLNLALAGQETCILFLGKYLKELIIPLLPVQGGSQIPHQVSPDFSSIMAISNSKEGLFNLILRERNKELNFENFTIYTLNEDGDTLVDFFSEQHREKHFQKNIKVLSFPVDDTLKSIYFDKNLPAVVDFGALEYCTDLSVFFEHNSRYKHHQVMFLRLDSISHRRAIGIFVFPEAVYGNNKCPSKLRSLISTISAKVFDVQQHEEEVELESENMLITQVRKELSGIEQEKTMLEVLNPFLERVMGFESHCLAMVQDDNLNLKVTCTGGPNFSGSGAEDYACEIISLPIYDKIIGRSLFSERPLCFDLELLRARNDLPDYLVMDVQRLDRKLIAATLKGQKNIIGLWMIWPSGDAEVCKKQLRQIGNIAKTLAQEIEDAH